MDRRDGHRALSPEREEVRGDGEAVVHLVDGDHHRLAGSAHPLHDELVSRHEALLPVADQQDGIGLLERLMDLALHGFGEPAALPEIKPAGIDEREAHAPPLGAAVDAVARGALDG